MSNSVLFEHPLNEKMRTWLRIEFLLQQLHQCHAVSNTLNALTLFRNLADLLDVLERGELRTDILKELDRQQQKLQAWINVPGVDSQIVYTLIDKLKQQHIRLMAVSRPGQQLREDRLIGLVRQRLSIPGGCCSFDLPTLHLWLHLAQETRDSQIACWLASLEPLHSSLTLLLDLIRQSGAFHHQSSVNGFYQGNAGEADLLRLKLTLADSLYPQISGHKSRYAIRFLPLDSDAGEVPSQLDFQLACC
ncbi:cell division protein ZapD [Erwinia sp. OLTSP20]|uniref:cell division protein ZapD n=1 Tax=unclassified Erwinia TaxID=2622719 RepID=UPI000C1A3660|nr:MULTISPECIES: cell division protein ZapD [unclassified Erwinia]PIJ49761.1 cell division protein ZapD [Erwinia sp. OAMSP11]PIJ70860.1 cell division protein ZapD [Erwinia sp. OLSSP12]PIJ80225.1 cell division protein ZapD [Erwinia sp. OLCASP19]PIJ82349.1 cell division protein ZapD [Erwinia sp. OLMTSP26]PIJ85035.1 cell division protein ZapD [Erwinia sp. OLMDSP33]